MDRTALRHVPAALRILALVLLAGALILVIALGTDRGRQALLDVIAQTTANPNFQLEMHGLQLGPTFTLAHLSLSDARGTWLEIQNATATPVFGDLLRGRISLEHLGLELFKMDRLPESGDDAGDDSAAFAFPPLRIQSIDADRIHLGEALVGHEAFLSLGGGVFIDQRQSHARLRIARLDRDGDELELDGRLQDNTLTLHLRLREEPQGLLHATLGVNGTEGISLNATGQGPLSAWPLAISGQISDAANFGGNATLNLAENPKISLRLDLRPGPAWTRLTRLPDSVMSIRAKGDWQGQELRLTALDLDSGFATLTANATWNQESRALAAKARGAFTDLSWIIPADISTGQTEAEATLLMDPSGLKTQSRVSLQDWNLAGNTLRTASADVTFDMPAGEPWRAESSIAAHIPSLPPGLNTWTANATLGGNATGFVLEKLRLDSERLEMTATGSLDSTMQLDTDLHLRELPSLAGGPPLSVRLKSSLSGQVHPDAPAFTGELSLVATEITGLPQATDQLLGREPKVLAKFSISPQRVDLHEALLFARTRATLEGVHNLDTGLFQAGFTATLPDLQSAGLNVTQGATLRGKASGTVQAFDLDLAAESRRILVGTLPVTEATATASLKGLPFQPAGTLQAKALVADEKADLRLRTEMQKNTVRIRECVLQLPGTTVDGSGTFDPATLIFEGDAQLNSQDLRSLGRILGTDLEGKLSLRANLAKQDAEQHVRVQAEGSNLSAFGLQTGTASLQSSMTPSGFFTDSRTELLLDSVSSADLRADRIKGNMRGTGEGLDFEFDLAHNASQSHLQTRGHFSPNQARLRIEELRGTLLRQSLLLETPLDITASEAGTSWPQTSLTFGPARLRTQGRVTSAQASISADLEHMDLALLRPLAPSLPSAKVSATLRVEGTPLAPDARLNVRAEELRTETAGLENLPDFDATAELRLRKDLLEATASVTSAKDLQINAVFSSPVQAELFSVTFPKGLPLAGEIHGRTALFLLPHFLELYDQTLDGKLETDFSLRGTWEAPRLEGSARIRDARYENFRSGTRIEALALDAVARDSRLELTANGTDGRQGKVEAQGAFDPLRQTYACDVNLAGFRLLRQDLVQSLGSGALHLEGTYDAAALNGTLTLDPTTVRLPSTTPADMAQIHIQEINTAASRAVAAQRVPSFRTDLDLQVMIPARLFVQGRGLDSEWAGQLHVGGNQALPVIRGEVNLLRGRFDFLDRSFELTKGSLSLNGDTPPNPFLDIIGEVQILDTLVQVHLNGPARNFRLTLTSVPNLPQDELLAMILFGRSMSQISPLQAVRLAQAAAELSGIGATPDFLDSIKSGLGLQELDVTKDEDDNTAVGVGGYFGGKYYIRTERNVSGQDSTKVEVQLTPKISVETEIGSDSRQGGGVNWKHDY